MVIWGPCSILCIIYLYSVLLKSVVDSPKTSTLWLERVQYILGQCDKNKKQKIQKKQKEKKKENRKEKEEKEAVYKKISIDL